MTRSALLLTTAALFLFAAPAPSRADDAPGAKPAAAAADAGVAFEPGTPAFADVLAKCKATGKPAFIDFATDWCGPCRMLEKDTFSQAAVGEVMKAFVNVHVDAEKGEGPALSKRYGVRAYPTLVVVDAAGDEIDRMVGYRPPEAFIPEMKRIASGEGTIPALKKKWAASPTDVDAGIALAARLGASNPVEAAKMLEGLIDTAKAGPQDQQGKIRAEHAIALHEAEQPDAALKSLEVLGRDYGGTPFPAYAAMRAPKLVLALPVTRALAFLDAARSGTKEPEELQAVEALTFSVLQKGMIDALDRQAAAAGDDPQALNAVAWTCFEQRVNLTKAVGWARTAVEKSERNPAVLDTLANLLWLTDAKDEAVKLETEAAETADEGMKAEFQLVLARWRAEMDFAAKK